MCIADVEQAWGSTNVFYRQIRNLIIDTTQVPANSAVAGVHWPTAQATSIQNVQFNMGQNSQHVGLFIESGSAGFLNDLTFNGGSIGLNVGNQQYTMRNLIFNNVSLLNVYQGRTLRDIGGNCCQPAMGLG